MENIMNTFYMLIGLPGSGKTTWCQNFKTDQPTTIISTDDIIQMIADKHRLTYNQIFDDLSYSFAEKVSHKIARYAFDRNDDVIWDQVNLTFKSRAKKLKLVPSHYKKIAVYFDTPTDLNDRLKNRPGKIIPVEVLSRMIVTRDFPLKEEGFDEIQFAQNERN